jgi:hypothetical protein
MHCASIRQEDAPRRKGASSINKDDHVCSALAHHLLDSASQYGLIKDGFMPPHDNEPHPLGTRYIADIDSGRAAAQYQGMYFESSRLGVHEQRS